MDDGRARGYVGNLCFFIIFISIEKNVNAF